LGYGSPLVLRSGNIAKTFSEDMGAGERTYVVKGRIKGSCLVTINCDFVFLTFGRENITKSVAHLINSG